MAELTPFYSASTMRFKATVVALLAVGIAGAAYAVHEHNVAKQLAQQNAAVTSTLNATRDQVNALTSRLDAMSVERPAEKTEPSRPTIYRKGVVAASTRRHIDDPRWKKMQGQLDEQGKQIDTTRQDLASARTELQGSIATTHDELVMLQKKGERNYYEFDLDKAEQFQREGPVGVRLRKANTKHQYADLELLVEDFKVSKKHVNIFEPVVLYSSDRKVPAELVINSIGKNHIHGYVSEPKYKAADLEAMAKPATNTASTAPNTNDVSTASSEKPSPVRQKLEPPNTN